MIDNKRLILVFFLSFLNYQAALGSEDIRVILLGHLYPILTDDSEIRIPPDDLDADKSRKDELLQNLFANVNALNPDYVAILGDSNLHNPKTKDLLLRGIKSEVLFAAGNNDLKGGKNAYLESIGYLETVVQKDFLKLVVFNSSESAPYLNEFFDQTLTRKNPSDQTTITLVLGHHRIWDDSEISETPYSHDKSYFFEEIYPSLDGRVTAIFAGNSKRQYFTDFEGLHGRLKPSRGKQNFNNIFWADKVGDISCYSVGTGEGLPKLGFVEVIALKNQQELVIKPHFVSVGFKDPINRQFVIPNRGKHHSSPVESAGWASFLNSDVIYLLVGVFSGVILGVYLTGFSRRARS